MATFIAVCPECKARLKTPYQNGTVKCPKCETSFKIRSANAELSENRTEERGEAEEKFLSGSSFLVLCEYKKAAELFLEAAKLSPAEAKNWLYLLCAITERFKTLYPIADEKASYRIGKRKVIFKSVYNNFIATAKAEEYIFAKNEFGIDLRPHATELWCKILDGILTPTPLKISLKNAADIAYTSTKKLLSSNPKLAKSYYPDLCKRLNPIHDGVLEINTLAYYPTSSDGVLRINAPDIDSVEFASDELSGSERFKAFLLTENIKSVGAFFPFKELRTDKNVTEIPERLMCFCNGIRNVKLSENVKKIGCRAFCGCINLSSVILPEGIEEIGNEAFFGTSVRTVVIPSTTKTLGTAIIGTKRTEDVQIEKYLIELDGELAEKSVGFNAVGEHFCGYLIRKSGKYIPVYPQKKADVQLTPDEKRIFEALICVNIDSDSTEKKPTTRTERTREFFSDIMKKIRRKNK